MPNIQDLLNRAKTIRDAYQENENTALRVGSLFYDIIRDLEQTSSSISAISIKLDNFVAPEIPEVDLSSVWNAINGKADETHTHADYLTIAAAAATYQPKGDYALAGHTHTFASLTSKPTTLAGYGITDAYTKTQTDNKFLTKAVFDELFEKVTSGGVTLIRAKFGLYSDDNVAAFGTPGAAGGGGGAVGGLSEDEIDALGYAKQTWVNTQIAASLAGYATQQWVNAQGFLKGITKAMVEGMLTGNITSHTHSQYLTSHQSLADYLTKTDAAATYQPLGNYALAGHGHAIADVTGLQAALDGKAAAGHTHSFASLTSKPTTLAGYGITDAYTKTQTDNKFLTKAVFDELFEKVTSGGVTLIRTKFGLFSDDNVAAFGSPGAAGGGGAAGGLSEDEIDALGYAKQTWVNTQIAAQLAGYVTLGTEQTISAFKTITGGKGIGCSNFWVNLQLTNPSHSSIEVVGGQYTMGLGCHNNGKWYWWRGTDNPATPTNKSYVMSFDGSTWDYYNATIQANKFKKKDGTSAQFLKADGSVDSNSYALASALSGYLPLTGGSLTGALNVEKNGLTLKIGAQNATGIHIYSSDTTKPIYFNTSLVMVGNGDIGNAVSYRAGTVYATALDVTSTALVSNLNADMLDGKHDGEVTAIKLGYEALSSGDLNDYFADEYTGKMFYGSGGTVFNNMPDEVTNGHAKSMLVVKMSGWYYQLFSSSNGRLYYRMGKTGNIQEWRKIAFTTDKVAAAAVADKVGTATVGSASLPVYISAGAPTACTAASLFSELTMSNNQLSATVAGQNRKLTIGYAECADFLSVRDTRNADPRFSQIAGKAVTFDFKVNGAVGVSNDTAYSAVMNVKPWSDGSGGPAHQLAFHNQGWIHHRTLPVNDGTPSPWGRLAEFRENKLYLDAACTVYVYYDATNDCVRSNKTIVSDGNVAAYGA